MNCKMCTGRGIIPCKKCRQKDLEEHKYVKDTTSTQQYQLIPSQVASLSQSQFLSANPLPYKMEKLPEDVTKEIDGFFN